MDQLDAEVLNDWHKVAIDRVNEIADVNGRDPGQKALIAIASQLSAIREELRQQRLDRGKG